MQHVHTGETGADDHRIERASLLHLGVLIRHAFSDVLFIRYLPVARACGAMSPRSATYSEGILSGREAPQPSISSRNPDCQFRVTMSLRASVFTGTAFYNALDNQGTDLA